VQAFFRLVISSDTMGHRVKLPPNHRGPSDQRTTAICERSPPL